MRDGKWIATPFEGPLLGWSQRSSRGTERNASGGSGTVSTRRSCEATDTFDDGQDRAAVRLGHRRARAPVPAGPAGAPAGQRAGSPVTLLVNGGSAEARRRRRRATSWSRRAGGCGRSPGMLRATAARQSGVRDPRVDSPNAVRRPVRAGCDRADRPASRPVSPARRGDRARAGAQGGGAARGSRRGLVVPGSFSRATGDARRADRRGDGPVRRGGGARRAARTAGRSPSSPGSTTAASSASSSPVTSSRWPARSRRCAARSDAGRVRRTSVRSWQRGRR